MKKLSSAEKLLFHLHSKFLSRSTFHRQTCWMFTQQVLIYIIDHRGIDNIVFSSIINNLSGFYPEFLNDSLVLCQTHIQEAPRLMVKLTWIICMSKYLMMIYYHCLENASNRDIFKAWELTTENAMNNYQINK